VGGGQGVVDGERALVEGLADDGAFKRDALLGEAGE